MKGYTNARQGLGEGLVNIQLDTNQADSTDLMGTQITVSYNGTEKVFVWNGNQITQRIPARTVYTISFSDIDGYKTPEPVTGTAIPESAKTIKAEYQAELVSVTLQADNNASMSGQTVNINGVNYTYTGSPITVKIPFGTTYSVVLSDKDKYVTPQGVTARIASQAVYNATFTYVYDLLLQTTIRIDQTITDPASMITRIVDGGAIEAIRANSHRYLGKYTADGTMTVCQLDDTDSNKYANGSPSNLKGAEGDVFMRMPQFYYKATEYATDVWDITFVYGGKPDDTYKEWSPNALIGVYEAHNSVGGLRSISNVDSLGNWSQFEFNGIVRNRGTGFQLVDWQMHCVMALLYYAQYGHTNCQEKIGTGKSGYSTVCGLTDSCGMNDTRGTRPVVGLNDTGANGNTQSINFWGLENWWGNKEEFIDNAVWFSASWNVIEPDGTFRTIGKSMLAEGYISGMFFGDKCDLAPTSFNGSSSSGFCDACHTKIDGNSQVVSRSGTGDGGADNGIAYLSALITNIQYSPSNGSRIAFRGQVVEETNVQTFKGLPVDIAEVNWESQSGTWNPSTSSDAADGVIYTCESPGADGSTIIRCTFSGITSITFTCMYEGENDYDYLTIGELDTPCTRDSYRTSLKGKSGIASDITFTCDSGEHYVEFCYSKDSSENVQPDNATVYVKSYS